MGAQELVLVNSGIIGNNIGIGVFVASIINPGPGRWQVWGKARHSLGDGIRFRAAAVNFIPRIPGYINETVDFGPLVIDVANYTDDFILDLATATGPTDTAAGIIYAQLLSRV
jgi:hypothetical protein